jgi:putative ABC transport system ATP-binding protein
MQSKRLNKIIELVNISKHYASTQVLKNINLTVEEGEFIVVRGKSGMGKTTLFKIMGLLESPNDGVVRLFGKNVHALRDGEKSNLRLRELGLVFQFFNLLPSLTVLENVELPMALAGVKKSVRRARALELLWQFGLGNLPERFPESLSGGERQRVAVIRALVNNPRLLLADEPTSSLDDENAALVMELLGKINSESKVTVVVTTTDLYEPFVGATDYILRNGRLERNVVGFEVSKDNIRM